MCVEFGVGGGRCVLVHCHAVCGAREKRNVLRWPDGDAKNQQPTLKHDMSLVCPRRTDYCRAARFQCDHPQCGLSRHAPHRSESLNTVTEREDDTHTYNTEAARFSSRRHAAVLRALRPRQVHANARCLAVCGVSRRCFALFGSFKLPQTLRDWLPAALRGDAPPTPTTSTSR